ncbi:zinc finger protein [Oryctes borbonicus]|uniref:Zinc finger protein n=1 Tax=Oryctes borbonicus TaxID=1629725 RepID=A0A0T6BGN8_9SCAR|nr:zinc finger protein [Oryctes borbonicus]
MMEIEQISYIFGSFARRRQSQEVVSTHRSSSQPKISHDRSRSAPHTSKNLIEFPLQRAKSACHYASEQMKFKCPLCRNLFVEPRVLPCLHTFCTPCLQKLADNSNEVELQAPHQRDDTGCARGPPTSNGHSGPTSERHTTKTITCCICTSCFELFADSIKGFPPNYMLQHRMVLATLNSRSTKLLCDLCTNDTIATCRCSECAISLCQECADNHGRQRNYVHHEVLRLEEARRRGITKVRRQIMCPSHPDNELSIFCSSCCQVSKYSISSFFLRLPYLYYCTHTNEVMYSPSNPFWRLVVR